MKKLLFYVFNEHTNYVRECEKIGMVPFEVEEYDTRWGTVKEYKSFNFDGIVYKVLDLHECFSGWTITIMALPELSYPELLKLAMNSRHYDEIVGSVGIILKKHLNNFVEDLKAYSQNNGDNRRIKRIKKIVKRDIYSSCDEVKDMEELLRLC